MKFDFLDRSGAAARAVDQLRGETVWLDDRRIPGTLGRVVSARSADLLSLAMCCYAADRVALRPASWRRELHLRIPVADARAFRHAIPELERWLCAITDDRWRLELVTRRMPRGGESQLVLGLPDREWDAVGLFSGGLDSFAGAAVWLDANRDGGLVLVGAQSSTVVAAVQRRLAARLQRSYPGRVVLVGIPLHLEATLSRDSWQRSRAFLFQVLAAVVAQVAMARAVLVFENGYGALNPRLGEHQAGSQAAKSAHPRVLEAWTRWARSVGYDVAVALPHRWDTKAELVARIPFDLRVGIAETESCDAFPLHRHDVKQCGCCGSCVLRRQSVVAAGLATYDRIDYARDPLGGSDVARLMAYQAWQFQRLTSEAVPLLHVRWPELAMEAAGGATLEAEMNLALLHRYGAEWAALAESDASVARAVGWGPGTAEAA